MIDLNAIASQLYDRSTNDPLLRGAMGTAMGTPEGRQIISAVGDAVKGQTNSMVSNGAEILNGSNAPAPISAAPGFTQDKSAGATNVTAQNPMPAAPAGSPQVPSAVNAMSKEEFSKSPDAYTGVPARPVSAYGYDKWGTGRKVLLSAFQALGNFASERMNRQLDPYQEGIQNNIAQSVQAQRQYDQNLPQIKAGALASNYNTYLGQQKEKAAIASSEAQRGLTQAETEKTNIQNRMLQQVGSPVQQAGAQFREKMYGLIRQPGGISPGVLQQTAQEELKNNPVLNNLTPEARQSMLDDVMQSHQNWNKNSFNNYKVEYDPETKLPLYVTVMGQRRSINDPSLPDGAKTEIQKTAELHTQKLNEETNKEKNVAGFAADRQAQAAANNQRIEKEKSAGVAFLTGRRGINSANQEYNELNGLYNTASQDNTAKGAAADTTLLVKALGISLPEGVHRINDTELNLLRHEGSLPEQALTELSNWSEGKRFTQGLRDGLMQVAQNRRDAAIKKHSQDMNDASTLYGVPVPNFEQGSAPPPPPGAIIDKR